MFSHTRKRYSKSVLLLVLTLSFSFIHSTVSSANVDAKANQKAKRTYKSLKLEKRKNRIVYRKVLQNSVPVTGAPVMHASSYTGSGTYVVIIDSGINSSHPMLSGKIALEACFTVANSCPNKTNKQTGTGSAAPVDWHGSHVSAIAAGTIGVAPAAKIIAVNVFDKDQSSDELSIVNALNWVLSISSKYNIASVNMSLGTSRVYQGYCDTVSPKTTTVIHSLYDKNIPVVVAAGNSYSIGMSNPACISKVVSVAATNLNSYVTPFSNLSSTTTFAAPGLQIVSAAYGTETKSSSGTSMAAPHVAGILALYRQAYPDHNISKMLQRLIAASPLSIDPYSSLRIPAINVSKLLETPMDPPVTTVPPTTAPVVTTTTMPLVIPTNPPMPAFKPNLTKIRANSTTSNFFYILYNDSLVDKTIVLDYKLECSDGSIYTIPLNVHTTANVYLVNSTPNFNSCIMYANLKDGTRSASSSSVIIKRG
jgi:subtilisin family serine protease